MKRIFKILAVMLVLTLVIGVIPASAASDDLSLTKKSKTLFVGGCKGHKSSTGKKAPYRSYSTVSKLLKGYDDDTMIIRLSSSDKSVCTVSNNTTKIKAKGMGSATVTVKVYKNSVRSKNLIFTDSIKVTVKKNATDDTFKVSGSLTDGATYKVGQSVDVALSRAGIDTDARRLVCDADGVEIKSSGTRTWKVSFLKPGTYVIRAEAYQTSTYDMRTAGRNFTVTVESDRIPLSGKQTSLNSFLLQGDAVTESIAASDIDVCLVDDIGTEYRAACKISTIAYADGAVTVNMFDNFEAGKNYRVKIGDEKYEFIGASCELKDVASFKINTDKIKLNEETALDISYFDANGVDITSAVKTLAAAATKLEVVSGIEFAFGMSSTSLIINDKKTATIKLTLTKAYDEKLNPVNVTAEASITGYEEEISLTKVIWTVAADDGVYMLENDTNKSNFPISDSVSLEALFVLSNGKVKTFADMGYTKDNLKVIDPSVVVVTGVSASGGFSLYANKEGSTSIVLSANDGTFIASFPIEVQGMRKPVGFTVECDKSYLNLNPACMDKIKVTATVYDQYGDKIVSPGLSVEQDAYTKTNTGTVNFTGFSGDTMYISYSDVVVTGTQNMIRATVSCAGITGATQIIAFTVKDVAANVSEYSRAMTDMIIEDEDGKPVISTIDTTLNMGSQNQKLIYVYADFEKEGFMVDEGIGENIGFIPSIKSTAADFGVADGYTGLFNVITRNGSSAVIIPDGINIDATPDYIEFTPVAPGQKLEAGNYTVTLYKVTANASSSIVEVLNYANLTIVDGVGEITCKRIANSAKVTGSPATIAATFFEFYYDGVKIDPLFITDAEVPALSGQSVVKWVTFAIPNDTYGSFDAKYMFDVVDNTIIIL